MIHGAPAHARRLTDSAANSSGIGSVTADGRDVMVTGRRNYVKQLLVGPTKAAWGRNLARGFIPTLGAGGRFVFIEPYFVGHSNAGYWKVYAGRLGHRGLRVVLRTATTRDGEPIPVAAWGPGNEIAILLGHRLILDAGTSHAHDVGGLERIAGSDLTGGGPDGMLAVTGKGGIGLLMPGGRMRVIKTSAGVDAFSPDGRDLLVTDYASRFRPDRLSVISTRTGAITPLISADGYIHSAAWGGP